MFPNISYQYIFCRARAFPARRMQHGAMAGGNGDEATTMPAGGNGDGPTTMPAGGNEKEEEQPDEEADKEWVAGFLSKVGNWKDAWEDRAALMAAFYAEKAAEEAKAREAAEVWWEGCKTAAAAAVNEKYRGWDDGWEEAASRRRRRIIYAVKAAEAGNRVWDEDEGRSRRHEALEAAETAAAAAAKEDLETRESASWLADIKAA